MNDLKSNLINLFSVSEIYKNHFPIIQQDPSGRLMNEVLSRLKSRSDLVKKFATDSRLLLQSCYSRDESVKALFASDDRSIINRFFTELEGHHVFIETKHLETNHSSIHMVHQISLKLVNSFNFQMKITNPKIITNDCRKKGIIFFTHEKTVYLRTFEQRTMKIVDLESDVKDLFLAKYNRLIVVTTKSVIKIQLNESINKVISMIEYQESDEIILVKSNHSEEKVYSIDFMNKVACVKVIVGLSNRLIKLYLYESKSDSFDLYYSIDSFDWTFYGFGNWIFPDETSFRESLIIDELFIFENNFDINNENLFMRFAIEEKSVIKVIDVFTNKQHSIVCEIKKSDIIESIKNTDDMIDTFSLELDSIFNDKIMLKLRLKNKDWLIFNYDIGIKSYIFKRLSGMYIQSINKNTMLIEQNQPDFFMYEISENEIKKIFHINQPYNNKHNIFKNEVQLKNSKLLRLEPGWRKTIDEFSFSSYSKQPSIKNKSIEVRTVCCAIDENHLLVELKTDDEDFIELAIIDVVNNNNIRSSLVIKREKNYTITILNSSKDYVIILKGDHLQSKAYYYIYQINPKQEFDFVKIIEVELELGYGKVVKCVFDGMDSQKLVISYNSAWYSSLKLEFIEISNIKNDSTYVVDTSVYQKLPFAVLRASKNNKVERSLSASEFQKFHLDLMKNFVTQDCKELCFRGLHRSILYEHEQIKFKIELVQLDLTNLKLKEFDYNLINDGRYLVIWDKSPNPSVYYVLTSDGTIFRKFQLKFDLNINDYYHLNDKQALVILKGKVILISLANSEYSNIETFRDYGNKELRLRLDHQCLLLWLHNEEHFELCRFNDFNDDPRSSKPIFLNQKVTDSATFKNGKYLIVATDEKELFIYCIDKMSLLNYVKFDRFISTVGCTNDYIYLILESNLLIFKMIE